MVLTFRNRYLERYETPSGGDWSIHRGAAVFVDGAVDVHVDGCTFSEVRFLYILSLIHI